MRRTVPVIAVVALALGLASPATATTPGSLNQLQGDAGCITAPPVHVAIVERATPEDACSEGIGLGPTIASGDSEPDDLNGIAASPDGKNVYVANQDLHLDDSSDEFGVIVVFAARPDGSLSQGSGTAACISDQGVEDCAVGRALNGAKDLVVSPDGKNVYVAAPGSNAIAVLDRAADGTLSQREDSGGCVSQDGFDADNGDETCTVGRALEGVSAIAISQDGKTVYAVASSTDVNGVAVFRRLEDGSLEQLDGADGCTSDSGADGVDNESESCTDGRFLYEPSDVAVHGNSVYVAVSEGRPGYPHGPGAIAVFTRDPDTGAITQADDTTGCVTDVTAYFEQTPDCTDARGLEDALSILVSPDGKNVYVAAQGGSPTDTHPGAVTVFKRAVDGTLTQLAGLEACVSGNGTYGGGASDFERRAAQEGDVCTRANAFTEPSGLAISDDGVNLYVTAEDDSAIAVLLRNSDTGALKQLDGLDGCVSDDGSPQGEQQVNQCVDGRALEEATRMTVIGCTLYATARDAAAVDTFRRCHPVTSAAVPPCSPSGAILVTVTGRPGGAQQKTLHFRVDGGAEQTAKTKTENPGTVTVTVGQGSHTLEYWGEDEQGLVEPTRHSATVVVGNCAPPGAVLGVTEENARACTSRRAIRIRVRETALRGARVRFVSVRLIRPARNFTVVRRNQRIRSVIDLRGLARGRYTVFITVKLTDGRTLTGKRHYRTCTAARPGGLPKL